MKTNYDFKTYTFIIAVICFIVAVIINIQTTNKTYQTRVKRTFFSELLHVFDKNIKYARNQKIPSSYFENCKLYNHTIEIRTDDDVFYGNYKDVDSPLMKRILVMKQGIPKDENIITVCLKVQQCFF